MEPSLRLERVDQGAQPSPHTCLPPSGPGASSWQNPGGSQKALLALGLQRRVGNRPSHPAWGLGGKTEARSYRLRDLQKIWGEGRCPSWTVNCLLVAFSEGTAPALGNGAVFHSGGSTFEEHGRHVLMTGGTLSGLEDEGRNPEGTAWRS